MGQLFFTDDDDRRWVCGWDGNGYYANRENDKSEVNCSTCSKSLDDCDFCPRAQEFDVQIDGVANLDELERLTFPYGFILDGYQRVQMTHDRFLEEHPNPGSDEAIKLGCTCPILDNFHGAGLDDGKYFWYDENCPVHVKKQKVEPND
jgi:hypothetical protein